MGRKKWVISGVGILFFLVATTVSSNAQMRESLKSASGMSKSQIAAMENSLALAYQKAMTSAQVSSTSTKMSVTTKSSADTVTKCSAGGYIHTTMSLKIYAAISTSPSVTTDGSGHQIISNWRCINNWIINGDPYISRLISGGSFGGQTKVSYYLSGGWKATGPNKQKQSCQTNGTWQYSTIGASGVSTVHVSCVPGGKSDITLHW